MKVAVQRLDNQLAKSKSGWFVGNSVTIADLRVCCCDAFLSLICQFFGLYFYVSQGQADYIPKEYLEQFKHVTAHAKQLLAIPKIQQYYASKK